ncbi:MAG: hypothetical protein QOD88_3757, partial [Mycobacterium sp.]|nr:hypothetical protein [Mycobacterium sp.]
MVRWYKSPEMQENCGFWLYHACTIAARRWYKTWSEGLTTGL